MNSNKNIEILLRQKIEELGHFLVSICDNENKKKEIKDSLIDLPFYKILLFITFLDKDKQINDFINLFSLNNTEENRDKILEYLNYFLQIKSILNE